MRYGKKRPIDKKCECGKPGSYRYSYELTVFLGIHPWVGLYICDECMRKIEEEYKSGRTRDE